MSSGQAHNVQVRVLVVEDHVALANRIGEGLRDAGFAVDVVHDGDAALRNTTSTDYDVVVLDRDLPAVHGDRVCRRLVRDGSPSRILMLTAAADVEDRIDGLELGRLLLASGLLPAPGSGRWGEPAVDAQGSSCYRTGPGAGEECDGGRNLLRGGEPAQRNLLFHLRDDVLRGVSDEGGDLCDRVLGPQPQRRTDQARCDAN